MKSVQGQTKTKESSPSPRQPQTCNLAHTLLQKSIPVPWISLCKTKED